MGYLRKSCVFVFLLALALRGYSGDSLHINTFNAIQLLNAENLWLKTGNSSGLYFNQKQEVGVFDVGAATKEGDYHRIREGSNVSDFSFNATSYKTLGEKMFVSGLFSYHFMDEEGAQWSGTYDPYNGSPYLLADSLSGTTWHKENFRLKGQIAYMVSNRWILGFDADYLVAVAAKQKDPRPENIVTRLRLNPSVILKKDNYSLGFDLGYRNWKEEIDYKIYRSNFNATFFMFKGFGFHSKEIDYGYSRFLSGTEYFGGIQFEKDFKGLKSLTDARFTYSFEGIEDGGSTIIKEDGGDWATYKVELREQLKKNSGNKLHILEANAAFLNGDGTEYTQERIKDGDNYIYRTIAKNLKFNRQLITGNVLYNYFVKKDDSRVNWNFKAAVDVISNSETYFYIPEIFTASYFNLGGLADIQKNFYFKNIHFAPSIHANYIMNLSQSLVLSSLPEITKNQRQDVFKQEFDFYTADVLKMGGKIQAGFVPNSIKTIGEVNISLNVEYWKPVDWEAEMTEYCVKVGIVF